MEHKQRTEIEQTRNDVREIKSLIERQDKREEERSAKRERIAFCLMILASALFVGAFIGNVVIPAPGGQ